METIKTVPIELGGKKRNLRYDANALIDLGEALSLNLLVPEGWEKLVGKTYPDVESAIASLGADAKDEQIKAIRESAEKNPEKEIFVSAEPTLRSVRAIVWAGLRHEDDSLTERQIGAMLDPAQLGPVIAAYQEAWRVQDVTEAADEGPKAEPAASGAARG